MPSKSNQTTSPSTRGVGTSTDTSAPSVRLPEGNAAAVERAGIGRVDAAELNGDISGGLGRAWAATKDLLGLDDSETEDALALAKQTASNLSSAQEKLGELAGHAREHGLSDAAVRLDEAAKKLATPSGLADELTGLMEDAEKIALVEQLLATTLAVVEVDLRSPEAAGTFDRWCATLGAVGEELADRGGLWGPVLKPFATFVKLFGETRLFTFVRDNYGTAHGLRNPQSETARVLRELDEEGY